MNTVTYTISLLPENAQKIDAINKIILGATYSEEAPTKSPAKKPVETATEAASTTSSKKSSATVSTITLANVKTAVKAAKATYDETFVNGVVTSLGIDLKDTLGRTVSAVPADKYEEFLELLEAGPQASEADLAGGADDDWEEDEAEEVAEVTPDAVKLALKAYGAEHGRDEAKAIMTKYKVVALSKVADLAPAKLAAMMAELV